MKLSEYQHRAAATDIMTGSLTMPMLGLAGEVGSILAEFKKHERDRTDYGAFQDRLREELGDLLWYAAAVARRSELSLEQIAEDNLAKTEGRFKRPRVSRVLSAFDLDAPPEQRLPRRLEVRFTQHQESAEDAVGALDLLKVSMAVEGVQVGATLDDNSAVDDEYRFHDAFHLAYMTYLGWSPVMRLLLKRKRKYSPHLDRTEDGARAVAREEGLSAMVFEEAQRNGRFRTAQRVPWDLIKFCRSATDHLEVAARSPLDWEEAILNGYRVFNLLTDNGGGIVRADLDARSLSYSALEESDLAS